MDARAGAISAAISIATAIVAARPQDSCEEHTMKKQAEKSPRLLPPCPTDIFILSGQSNMSGRGGVEHSRWDGVVPPECASRPTVLRFNAAREWEVAAEPLHADIDASKVCGVGPGMPFADALLGGGGQEGKVVGLVPCAIGGTAIAEWAKGKKLYEQMVARAKKAVDKGGRGEIRAVLWYQGESDTDKQAQADVYGAKMQQLVEDVRADLGLPELPFVQVALASGYKQNLIEQVRAAQLGLDLPGVACVDAKGLPLKSDKLHLTTEGQVQLGGMLADTYLCHFSRRRGN